MNDLKLPDKLEKDILSLDDWIKSVVVINQDGRNAVYAFVQDLKRRKACVIEALSEMKSKTYQAWKAVCSFESANIGRIDAAEKAGKTAIQAYDEKMEKLRKAEEDRLNAIEQERIRREKAKLAAEEAAARQKAAEAEARAAEARKEAEKASKEEREKLLREAQAAELKAAAAQAKAEAKAETSAAIIPHAISVASTVEKNKGESLRKIWKSEILNAKEIPVEYLALWIDPKKVDDFARATKGAVPVKGVRFFFENTMSVRV